MEKLLCPRKARGSEEDRNKLGTSRLPPDVLPETSPGDLQGEREDLASMKLPSRSIIYVTSQYLHITYIKKEKGKKKGVVYNYPVNN